jgi:hypothetical protein
MLQLQAATKENYFLRMVYDLAFYVIATSDPPCQSLSSPSALRLNTGRECTVDSFI